MAEAFDPQGSRPDIQSIAPGQVQDIQVGIGTSAQHGIYFEAPIPADAWAADPATSSETYMAPIALGLDHFLADPNVSDAYWTQELDGNGLLANFAVFTVTIPTPAGKTGPFTATVPIQLGTLGNHLFGDYTQVQALIDAQVARLHAAANA